MIALDPPVAAATMDVELVVVVLPEAMQAKDPTTKGGLTAVEWIVELVPALRVWSGKG